MSGLVALSLMLVLHLFVSTGTAHECGGLITNELGEIESPGFPGKYSNSQTCTWKIISPKRGEKIRISFNRFHIEEDDNCQRDYIVIRDGETSSARLLGRFCGENLPENLWSTTNKIWIQFVSDGENTHTGFKLKYVSLPSPSSNAPVPTSRPKITCRHEKSGFLGTVTSMSYPENYNNSLRCEWIIKSERSTKVQLRIIDFKLEHSYTCQYDFLEVYDGLSRDSTLLGRYCGEKYPDLITSTSNKMYLYFQTDKSDTYRGFEATWLALYGYSIDEGKSPRRRLYRRQVDNDNCGQVFTSKTGILTSPNYPGTYPSDSTCYWTIKSGPFHQIVLTFEDFEMEQHSDCRYDYLMIRDGGKKDARVIGKYCGQNSPNVIRAETNALRLELISDSTTERKGFKATWKLERKESVTQSDCGGKLSGETGIVMSPNYPDSGERPYICVWSITVPKGGRVKFEFTDVNITAHPGCGKGYVQLNDGKTRFDPNLGVYCGDSVPKPLIASANSLCVGYLSDGSGTKKGFKGKWTTIYTTATPSPAPKYRDTPCGEVFFEQTGRIFRTTGLTNCSWTIKVPSNKHIVISFGDLDMLDNGDCRREQVEIRDGVFSSAPLLMRTCGQLKPSAVRSTSNEVVLKHIVAKPLRSTRVSIYWKTIEVGKKSDVFDEITCGLSNIPKSVTNGDKGALPWTIGIMGLFNRAHCGGAILSPNWVITSAHCFERLPWTMLWSVRAGEYDMMKTEGSEQNRKIRQIIIHPEYNPITYDNDIALLRLDQPLTMTPKVKSVCLPQPNMDVPDRKICSIAGWGTNRYLSRRPSGPLEHILPEIVSQNECNKAYAGKITDNMICAGGNGLDSCQGDGGSPLSCTDHTGKYYVVGLSSWGNGCAFPGKHGVYTDVRRKIAWIKETVTDYGKKK